MAVSNLTTPELQREILRDGAETAVKKYRGVSIPGRILLDLLALDPVQPECWTFVAAHSETPSRVLRVMLESPQLPTGIRDIVCEHPRLPQELMVTLAKAAGSAEQMALAGNRFITPQAIDILMSCDDWRVRACLSANPALSRRHEEILAEDNCVLVRGALARRKQLDATVACRLAEDRDLLVRGITLTAGGREQELLLKWADSDRLDLQMFLLLRRELPSAVIESLSFSKHETIQLAALRRRTTFSLDELFGWAQSPAAAIRAFVASRPGLPPEAGRRLAKDPQATVREALAGNPELGETEALTLAQDEQIGVLYALAGNTALPPEVLAEMCRRGNDIMRRFLSRNTDLPEQGIDILLRDGDETLAFELASRGFRWQDMPVACAETLLRSELPSVRAFAAACRHLGESALQRLSVDSCPAVRAAVAGNPATPESILKLLAQDAEPDVNSLAQNRLETRAVRNEAVAEKPVKQIVKRLLGFLEPKA